MAQMVATRGNQGGSLAARTEHPLARLARDFDILFDRLLGAPVAPLGRELQNMRVWDFDVSENDKGIVIRAEVPGFEENELDVQLDDNILTIKAEKQQKDNGHQEYRSFVRSVVLPPGIKADQVQATYRNGVLELHIPRAEGMQPKRIKVESQQAGAGQQAQQGQPAANQGEVASSAKAKK